MGYLEGCDSEAYSLLSTISSHLGGKRYTCRGRQDREFSAKAGIDEGQSTTVGGMLQEPEDERTPLSGRSASHRRPALFQKLETHWVPSDRHESLRGKRSWRRRAFLLIAEPETSLGSAIFFFFLISAIFASNVLMIMQTMNTWQYTPEDCRSCGGDTIYYFEDDTYVEYESGIPCVCPPEPLPFTIYLLDYLVKFFTVEWCLRVLLFVPREPSPTLLGQCGQWLGYVMSASTLLDALAIFPYYLENLPNSLVSLRLIRLLRIFQLVRLGQYNSMFRTLSSVLAKSVKYLRLLILILAFGAAIFGSLVFWLERGTWKYHAGSESYQFIRIGVDGVTEEPTPFDSIPKAFWWFMVTATTVGYGDYYPTSTAGKWVGILTMLMGVLVIAFPVSVFSDLWSHELKQVEGYEPLEEEDTPHPSEEENSVIHRPEHVPGSPTYAGESNPLYSSDTLTMKKQDLLDIVECVYNIQESQKQLKSILRKYKLQHDNPS